MRPQAPRQPTVHLRHLAHPLLWQWQLALPHRCPVQGSRRSARVLHRHLGRAQAQSWTLPHSRRQGPLSQLQLNPAGASVAAAAMQLRQEPASSPLWPVRRDTATLGPSACAHHAVTSSRRNAGQGICSFSEAATSCAASAAQRLRRNASKQRGQKAWAQANARIASPPPTAREQTAHSKAGALPAPAPGGNCSLVTSTASVEKT